MIRGFVECLLEPPEKAIAINEQFNRALFQARAGVAIEPMLPLDKIHAVGADQRRKIGGFGQPAMEQNHSGLDSKIPETRRAGYGILDQRHSVALHNRAETL